MSKLSLLDVAAAMEIFNMVKEAKNNFDLPDSAKLYLDEKLRMVESSILNDFVDAATENVSVFDELLNWPKEDVDERKD